MGCSGPWKILKVFPSRKEPFWELPSPWWLRENSHLTGQTNQYQQEKWANWNWLWDIWISNQSNYFEIFDDYLICVFPADLTWQYIFSQNHLAAHNSKVQMLLTSVFFPSISPRKKSTGCCCCCCCGWRMSFARLRGNSMAAWHGMLRGRAMWWPNLVAWVGSPGKCREETRESQIMGRLSFFPSVLWSLLWCYGWFLNLYNYSWPIEAKTNLYL